MLPFVICLDLQHYIEVSKIPLTIYRNIIAGFDSFTLRVIRLKLRKSKNCNTMKSLMS